MCIWCCLVSMLTKYNVILCLLFQVVVHFVDGTTVEGQFLYCQEHYKIAFYKIVLDKPTHLPSFNMGVKWAEEVFILGRDGSSHLRISHGRVQYLNAHVNERHHYMYIHGVDAASEVQIDCISYLGYISYNSYLFIFIHFLHVTNLNIVNLIVVLQRGASH